MYDSKEYSKNYYQEHKEQKKKYNQENRERKNEINRKCRERKKRKEEALGLAALYVKQIQKKLIELSYKNTATIRELTKIAKKDNRKDFGKTIEKLEKARTEIRELIDIIESQGRAKYEHV